MNDSLIFKVTYINVHSIGNLEYKAVHFADFTSLNDGYL